MFVRVLHVPLQCVSGKKALDLFQKNLTKVTQRCCDKTATGILFEKLT